MNIENLKKQLIIDESCKLYIYEDHLGNPTFGIGHLIRKTDPEFLLIETVVKGGKVKLSRERVDAVFAKDVEICLKDCRRRFKEFDKFCDEAQEIIANMMFNMGYDKFSGFKKLIKAIEARDFAQAAKEMIDSSWYIQTKDRAKRLVARMEKLAEKAICEVNPVV